MNSTAVLGNSCRDYNMQSHSYMHVIAIVDAMVAIVDTVAVVADTVVVMMDTVAAILK